MVQVLPMSGGGGVVRLPRDNSDLINLRLLQEALGSVGDVGAIVQQQAQGQALADALMGKPGQPATTAGGAVQLPGNALTAQGGNEFTPGAAATPALLPPHLLPFAQQLARAGKFDEAVSMVTDYQASQAPPTPYQQAQLGLQGQRLDLAATGQQTDIDLRRQGLDLDRAQFASDQEYNRAKLALDERELALEGQTAGTAKLSDISSFRGQYAGLSEDFIATRDAYGKLRAAADNPSAAGDVALISGYMKMIDPSSVVRENEYATAANAAGVPEIVRGYWNRLVNGERLTSDQRTDFARQAHGIFASQLEQQEQLQGSYRGIASRMAPNVLPDDAVPDFVGKSREWQPLVGQPTATEAASPVGPVMGAVEESFEDLVRRYAR